MNKKIYRVNVYDQDDHYLNQPIGRVQYNQDLDYWNGNNICYGSFGNHLGITKLKKPINGKSFVLVHGSDYQGSKDYGLLVTSEEAKQAVMESEGNTDYFMQKWWKNEVIDLEEEE